MTTAQLAAKIWNELYLAQQFDSAAIRDHRLGNIKKLCEGVLNEKFIVTPRKDAENENPASDN